MYVKDLEGNEYPLQATMANDYELNGNQSLSFRILPNKVNKLFIQNITQMWEVVDHDEVEHKVVYFKKRGVGDKLTVEIKAIPKFFDKFNSDRIYEVYNERMTANRFFSILFANTGFNFVLLGTFQAQQWEGLGKGDAKLNIFKNGLNRYKAEFRLQGNTVYLENLIGRDTDFMYRHKLNASNIVVENDATEFYTYARGYGNYDEGEEENAKLIREYTSPLANIPGIGIRHSPPIYDGRITTSATMDERLKELVDNSLKISVSATIHDLRKQNYPFAQPELGDRVFLIDERIDLNEEVRIVSLRVVRDWRGNLIDLQAIFGAQNITKRYQSNLQSTMRSVTQLLNGNIKLPFSVLDNAVAAATKALQNAQTELQFPESGGILSVDKNNPNLVTLLNSAGFGVSKDGGKTFGQAITGNGIVADYIVTGTLRGIYIEGVEISGSQIISQLNSSTYTKIENAFVESRGRHTRTWRGKTATHDIRLKLEKGYFRARNDNKDWSLYFSDWGISTYADGTGDDDASGYIEFHSADYSPTGSETGLTIGSLAGRIGIETDNARIYLNTGGAGVHVANLEETYYSIYAASFTQSSARELKRDIKDLQDNAVEVIKNMRIREYKRLTNGKTTDLDKWQAGLILDEAPPQLVDGIGIDLYTGWAYTTRALQDVIRRLEVLENA